MRSVGPCLAPSEGRQQVACSPLRSAPSCFPSQARPAASSLAKARRLRACCWSTLPLRCGLTRPSLSTRQGLNMCRPHRERAWPTSGNPGSQTLLWQDSEHKRDGTDGGKPFACYRPVRKLRHGERASERPNISLTDPWGRTRARAVRQHSQERLPPGVRPAEHPVCFVTHTHFHPADYRSRPDMEKKHPAWSVPISKSAKSGQSRSDR
jgi:hypothetical protein